MFNNRSRNLCSSIATEKGWKKDTHRNVVEINGEKWSFSVATFNPQCRQTYGDTNGFITLMRDGTLKKYKVKNFDNFTVSRISPSGIKAYNVVVKETDLQPVN